MQVKRVATYCYDRRQGAKLLTAIAILLLLSSSAFAQTNFRAVVISKTDSTAVPYAAVHIEKPGRDVVTTDSGKFSILLPDNVKQITLHITAIGIKSTIVLDPPFDKVVYIYVDVNSSPLEEFSLIGSSAEEIVRQAIAAIPANYANVSYFDHSFYRRYQKVNNCYVNLSEASPVVMFRLKPEKSMITAQEAFSVTQLRRSKYHPDIMNAKEDNPADLLIENPVYHLEISSLKPQRFASYQFKFDTAGKSNDYVIQYTCNDFSTDHHGISNYDRMGLDGEVWEKGELVIDRETFAIKKISRKGLRHKDYIYKYVPIPNNRFRYANHDYFFEFIEGDLQVEYALHDGRWYLDKIARQYTNEFYTPLFNEKVFVITDNFEWYSQSISRFTTADYVDKFYPIMATAIHNYDSQYWSQINYPFQFANKDTLYHDLSKDGPLENQFSDESSIDEYARKRSKSAGDDGR